MDVDSCWIGGQEEHAPGHGTLCALQNPSYKKLPAGDLRSHPSQGQVTLREQGFHPRGRSEEQ